MCKRRTSLQIAAGWLALAVSGCGLMPERQVVYPRGAIPHAAAQGRGAQPSVPPALQMPLEEQPASTPSLLEH